MGEACREHRAVIANRWIQALAELDSEQSYIGVFDDVPLQS